MNIIEVYKKANILVHGRLSARDGLDSTREPIEAG